MDGRIVRMKNDGSGLETFAKTGGRPLGLAWDAEQNLIVADGLKGLLSIDPRGQITVLATEAGGVPFLITDDVDVAKDGRIYFSDASSRFNVRDYVLDMLEGRPNGRLLRYDPKTRAVEVLIPELYFANGVAVAEDDSFVLVNETAALRVTRLWLTGPRAGERETFTDALPGYPDGIARGSNGRFWVAIFAPRVASASWLGPRPWLKKVVSRLPRAMWPAPIPYGCLIALDAQGKTVASLQDPDGSRVRSITSVEEHGGWLYFGTLEEPTIARLRLPE
jgi:sugar lactone lactonase YvrE